ncbi:MAG: hypothetical protein ACK5LC_05815 [Coprobacillaceae bacterium]
MNEGQKKFYEYILECTIDDKKDKAKSLLLDNFNKQNDNSFSKEDVELFHKEIMKILKSDKKDEVFAILNQFGSAHTSK